MLFWLLFLFGTTVKATSRISRPNVQVVNFAKPLEGRKLNGSVIEEIEGDTEVTCQFKCLEDGRCHSYNFGTLTRSEGSISLCQLSGSDRFVGLLNFTEDENFKYCGLQVIFLTYQITEWHFFYSTAEYRWQRLFKRTDLTWGLLDKRGLC